MKTLICNLIAGPGTGKSTTMAGAFSLLKLDGYNVEMAPEFAKDKVWEESFRTLDNQLYIFAKQHHRIWRLLGQVEVVITDCPLLLSLYYAKNASESFRQLVLEEHNRVESLNIFLTRQKIYNPKGRMQTEEEARTIDGALRTILEEQEVPYIEVVANEDAPWRVSLHVKDHLVGSQG